MKVRKMNQHRARLSCEKPTGYGWKWKGRKLVLLMWNMRGRRADAAPFKLTISRLR
jgi:hypothetical protein